MLIVVLSMLVSICANKEYIIINREDWISIDRLKPAYVDIANHNRDILTRSGRTSRPPLRFDMSHPNRGGM